MREFDRLRDYQDLAELADWSHRGPSVFYTGLNESGLALGPLFGSHLIDAAEYARAYGGCTIETTAPGAFLEAQRLYGEDFDGRGLPIHPSQRLHPDQTSTPWTPREADAVWRVASRRFAECARGDVVVFVEPGRTCGAFFEVELPALLANPDVATINGVERLGLLESLAARIGPEDDPPREAILEGLRRVLGEIDRRPLQITHVPDLGPSLS